VKPRGLSYAQFPHMFSAFLFALTAFCISISNVVSFLLAWNNHPPITNNKTASPYTYAHMITHMCEFRVIWGRIMRRKMAGEISRFKICISTIRRRNFAEAVRRSSRFTLPPWGISKFSTMAKAKQSNVSKADRVQLLQAVTKSVNKVAFNPSKARKDEALKAIDSLREFVEKQSKPKASKPKVQTFRKEGGVKLDLMTSEEVRELAKQLVSYADSKESSDEPKPKAKPKSKSKPKAKRKAKTSSRKRTPSEMVADSDEAKQQPKAVGPIAKGKKKTASVAEAKDKVAALGKRNAAAKAAKVAQQVEVSNGFQRLSDESPEDAIRRRAIEDAKRKALEAELLADFNADEVTGQIELNF